MALQLQIASIVEGKTLNSKISVDGVALEALIAGTSVGASHRSTSKTILLVEDEAFVRRATAEALESVGYRVVVAGSASEALESCRDHFESVDLLLADVVMPGMNGRELAAKFEIYCPGAQLLLMSGYPEQLALCELSSPGENYLAKPFSISTLLQRVREVLNKKLVELPMGS